MKHSGFGVFNSFAKFTGIVGKGAAELTFDREYIKERELLNREKPHHAGEVRVAMWIGFFSDYAPFSLRPCPWRCFPFDVVFV